MISSVVIKSNTISISFIKIEVDLTTGKMKTHMANYELNDELRKHVLDKHRVYLPCKIEKDSDEPYGAVLYVPDFWDVESIENYTQALMDELFLIKHNIEGCKNLKQIEQTFMLEVIVL